MVIKMFISEWQILYGSSKLTADNSLRQDNKFDYNVNWQAYILNIQKIPLISRQQPHKLIHKSCKITPSVFLHKKPNNNEEDKPDTWNKISKQYR